MTIGSREDYPLPDAPDPLYYVPLAEHERALAALRDALACGMTRIALLGPPGFGKSLLLRRLKSDRPPASRVFYVPFATLGAEELAPWLLSWMGAQASSLSDDDFITWARVEQRLGRRCVVLLDEAQSLPIEAAKRLGEWVSRAQGALQLVLSGIEGPPLAEVLDAFGPSLHRVGLRKPLRGEALRGFADALIERSVGCRADSPTWLWEEQELFDSTGGVPRLVKAELRSRLEKRLHDSSAPAVGSVAAAQQVALPTGTEALPAPALPIAARARAVRKIPKAPPTLARRRPRPLVALCLLVLLAIFMMPSAREPMFSASPAPPAAAETPEVSVHINALPWARIRIDGRPVGMTPLAGLRVAPGEHEVIATFPDGREMIKRIDVRSPSASISFP